MTHPLITKFCWGLVAVGTIIWLMIPLVFFLPYDAAAKAAWAAGLFVASEVIFWGGAIVLGPGVTKRLWARFKPRWPTRTAEAEGPVP